VNGIAASAAPDAGGMWLGGGLELLSAGSLRLPPADCGEGGRQDLATTLAFEAAAEYQLTDLVAVGVMPRFVVGISESGPAGSPTSDTMLDLRVRLSLGKAVTPQLRLYGFGALGYSIIYLAAIDMAPTNPSGWTVTGGAGATYAFDPRTRILGELAYEDGFQTYDGMPTATSFAVRYLELAAGIEFAVGN